MHYKLKIILSWDHTGCFFVFQSILTSLDIQVGCNLVFYQIAITAKSEIRILILHFHFVSDFPS